MAKDNDINAAYEALLAYDLKCRREKTSKLARELGLPRGYKSELGRMRKRLKQILAEIEADSNSAVSK